MLDGRYFQAFDEDGNPVKPERVAKPAIRARADVAFAPDGRAISFFGDLHPSFSGNVVKAMASAKQGYPGRLAHCSRAARRPSRRRPSCSRSSTTNCAPPCTT